MTGNWTQRKELKVVLETVNGGKDDSMTRNTSPKGVETERVKVWALRNSQKPKEGNSSQYKPGRLDKAISQLVHRDTAALGPWSSQDPGLVTCTLCSFFQKKKKTSPCMFHCVRILKSTEMQDPKAEGGQIREEVNKSNRGCSCERREPAHHPMRGHKAAHTNHQQSPPYQVSPEKLWKVP